MFRKRMIAIIAIGMSGLVACTPNTTTKPQESVTPQETTTVNNDESTSAEEGTSAEYDNTSDVYGRVDVEDICKHIMINGKQVDFPWTLNKLGEEYEFEFITDLDKEDNKRVARLAYNTERLAMVCWYEENNSDNATIIYGIDVNVNDGIILYDFDSDTSIEELVNKLGQPSELIEGKISNAYCYSNERMIMIFNFWNDSETLCDFEIRYEEVFVGGEK